MAEDRGSYVVRRQLGRRLRELREAAGKSIDDAVAARLISKGKLSRIENGKGRVTIGDVRALCWFYRVPDDVTDLLTAMAPATEQESWWEQFGDLVVPEWFGLYLSLETAANRIQVWDQDLVHGLLQTEDYARAVIAAGKDEPVGEVAEQAVTFRLKRQRAVLDRAPRARISVILGPGALMRVVGGPDGIAAQLAHLVALHRSGVVDIRVLPWTSGPYPIRGPFTLFDFDDPADPAVAYVEVPAGARYLEKPQELALYRGTWAALEQQSLSIEEYLR